jgi:hypothetical protein
MASKFRFMKKFLFPILILGSIIGVSSCNNGDYLADPQGNIPRPPALDGAEEGVIDGFFDSSYKRFTEGTWALFDGQLTLSGVSSVNKKPVATISLFIQNFVGPGEYHIIPDSVFGNVISYNIVGHEDSAGKLFMAKDGFGYGSITITAEGAAYKGSYEGVLQYVNPENPAEPGYDSVKIYDGRFNITQMLVPL